jgi:hypothetical protein
MKWVEGALGTTWTGEGGVVGTKEARRGRAQSAEDEVGVQKALLIPFEALHGSGDAKFAYVVTAKGPERNC